jgi:hypothetical protein
MARKKSTPEQQKQTPLRKKLTPERKKLRADLKARAAARQRRALPDTAELPLWPEKVEAGRLVAQLERVVGSFREEAHGNRELFLDDVFVAYLLAFFNPTLRTLRTLEDFSQTKQAQKHLSTTRICRSTLSDFNRLADPERLQPLVTELRAALLRKYPQHSTPSELRVLLKQVLAVDGTFFSAAADVAWAVGSRNQTAHTRHRARMDVQLDVQTWLPELIVVPEPGVGEAASAALFVKRGAIHIYDRGFGSFELLQAHYELQENQWRTLADFVLRGKSNQLHFVAQEERALTDAARAARVISDRIGTLPGAIWPGGPLPLVREIQIQMENGEVLRLLTSLLDVEVEMIGRLYEHRWQIELFFRWLKCFANFNHLISHSRSGVLLSFYVVLIGTLLMYLHTGYRPSKYAFALLGMAAQSGGDLEGLLPILRERERQCEVARNSAALRSAKKKAAKQG